MTEEEATNWIAGVFEEPLGKLRPDFLREDIPAWDSLGVLMLMAGLDEEFGIVLSDEELGGITRVGEILEVLRREGKLT